eukprot:m.242973 g.242973  ORF g.242973 m.242973 type:complete len:61 (+) comp33805_c3_seq15:103-285(+)
MSEISVKTQGQKVLTTWRHLGNETANLTNANTNATPTIKFCVSSLERTSLSGIFHHAGRH